MTELTLDIVKSQLKPQQRLYVDEDTVLEIQRLSEDPDYGEEFLSCYLDHLNVLGEFHTQTHTQYLNAVKFFTLVESDNSLTDAYIKTFPSRFTDRTRGHPDPDKGVMRSEASRYNKSQLVNEIRKIATIPVQLIHRHLLHAAILETANLMNTAKSEMVRQKAAATLITELKPAEDQVLNVKVDDNTTSVIDELRKATEALAAAEFTSVNAGIPLKQIADSTIIEAVVEEID